MRKLLLVLTMSAFFAWMAAAQTNDTSKSGSATSDKTSGTDAGQTTGSSATSGQTGEMSKGSATTKGEKTLKGCIVSEGGQNMLEEKGGQKIALTGQDVSAHVGHEVKVHGMYESGTSSDMSKTSTAGGGKTFNVSKIDHVSDTCTTGKSKTK